jgi:hypothetical protein
MDDLTAGLLSGAFLTVSSWPSGPGDWIRTAIALVLLVGAVLRLIRSWRSRDKR